jgi:hypothetical protein
MKTSSRESRNEEKEATFNCCNLTRSTEGGKVEQHGGEGGSARVMNDVVHSETKLKVISSDQLTRRCPLPSRTVIPV